MLACHAGGPGSIPGRCKVFYFISFTPSHWTLSYSLSKKLEEEIELNFLKSQKSTIFRQLEWEKLKKSAEAPGATLDHASLSFWKALRQAPKASEKSREITDKWKKVKNKQTSGTLRKRVPMGEKCKRAPPRFTLIALCAKLHKFIYNTKKIGYLNK